MGKDKAPETGIVFPTDKKGGRSTSSAGKSIIAAALNAVAAGAKAAEKCGKERNWRRRAMPATEREPPQQPNRSSRLGRQPARNGRLEEPRVVEDVGQ